MQLLLPQGAAIEQEMMLRQLSVYWSVGPTIDGAASASGRPPEVAQAVPPSEDLLLQPMDAVLQLRMLPGGSDAVLSVRATVPRVAVHLEPQQVPYPHLSNHSEAPYEGLHGVH